MAERHISQSPKMPCERRIAKCSSDFLGGGGSRCVTTPLTTPLRDGESHGFWVKWCRADLYKLTKFYPQRTVGLCYNKRNGKSEIFISFAVKTDHPFCFLHWVSLGGRVFFLANEVSRRLRRQHPRP